MCLIFHLFIWLLTLGYWNGWPGIGAVSCCQSLARLACVETVFPDTVCNGLSTVKVFPKYIYVKTADSRITVFTMSSICCVATRLAVSNCCRFSSVALGRDIDSFEKYHVILSGGPAVGMADSSAEGCGLLQCKLDLLWLNSMCDFLSCSAFGVVNLLQRLCWYLHLFFCYGVSFVFFCFAWTCGGSDLNDSYGRCFLSLYSWWSFCA